MVNSELFQRKQTEDEFFRPDLSIVQEFSRKTVKPNWKDEGSGAQSKNTSELYFFFFFCQDDDRR